MDDFFKIILIVLVILLCVVCLKFSYDIGYGQGQIDARNHKFYYQLERQEDGSQLWIKCPNECEVK